MKNTNPMLLIDFYKAVHSDMLPKKIEKSVSYFTPRMSRVKMWDKVVMFGLQAFIKVYLIDYFNNEFFSLPLDEVVGDAHAGTPDKKPDDEANDDHHSHQHGRAPSFTGKRFPLSMTKPHRPLAIRHPFRNRRCLFLFRRTLRPRQQERRFLGTGALLHLPLQTARGRGIRLRHAQRHRTNFVKTRLQRAIQQGIQFV